MTPTTLTAWDQNARAQCVLNKLFYNFLLPDITREQVIDYSHHITTLAQHHYYSLRTTLKSFGLTTKSVWWLGSFAVIPLIVKRDDGDGTYGVVIVKNDYQTFIVGPDVICLPIGGWDSAITSDSPRWNTTFADILRLMRGHLKIPMDDIFSHYDYLDIIVDPLSKLLDARYITKHLHVGFIGAHGDKCYSLMGRKPWLVKGRLALMYLLTYTDLMDMPRHQYREWIDINLPKYLPLMRRVEKQLGL